MYSERTLQEWDAYFQDAPTKTMQLVFSDGSIYGNSQIISEEMSLSESLCSEENLRYGCCESSEFTIRIAEPATSNKRFEGLYVDVIMRMEDVQKGLLLDDSGDYILESGGGRLKFKIIPIAYYGNFKVLTDTPSNDRSYRDLVCYDYMREILNMSVGEWYNSLTFPMTMKAFRDSFFAYIDYPQVAKTLINDSMVISGGYVADADLSGKRVVEAICELNGVFGHINRDNKFDYISLPSNDTLTYPWYINGTGKYEDYTTDAITGISVESNDGLTKTSVGTDGNVYNIETNILTYGMDGTQELVDAITTLLAHISQHTYMPIEFQTYGNPMLPVGTGITLNTRYKTINSFVMSRTLTGIQSLKDRISATGLKKYPKTVNSQQTQSVKNTDRIINSESQIVLKVDSNGKIGKAALSVDPDTGVSSFDINADDITFKASSTLNLATSKLNIESSGFSVTPQGRISSKSGKIGGWEIEEDMLHHTGGFEAGISGYVTLSQQGLYYYWTDSSITRMLDYYFSGLAVYDGSLTRLASLDYNGAITGKTLSISGTKSRVAETQDYGDRLLYCYETPTPMFGDIGEGKIAEDGKCYVWLDAIFAQTINQSGYQVFLQKYGKGDCYVSERTPNYFVVEGDAGLSFGWELKAKQADYEMNRLDKSEDWQIKGVDYGGIAIQHLNNIMNEREVAYYG